MIVLIYKKDKIQLFIKCNSSFEELNKKLYEALYHHFADKYKIPIAKIERIMHNILGF
jgi:hypothetical protein